MSVIMTHLLFLFGCIAFVCAKDRVKLRDVEVLTLRKGEMTVGRRSRPVPQLKCTGGCRGDQFDVAQCFNKGWDGDDIQWECKAEMPAGYRFGKLEVSCEGYDKSDDDYILKGSCGLEYELRDSSSSHKASYESTSGGGFSFLGLLVVAAIAFVAYMIYQSVVNPSAAAGTGDAPQPPPYSRHEPSPPPYGFGAEYMPGYGSSRGAGNCGTGFTSSSAGPGIFGSAPSTGASNGSGFWSGAAIGGSLGYLFGRRSGSNTPAASAFPSYSATPSSTSHTSQSSSHVSTGYASTKRR